MSNEHKYVFGFGGKGKGKTIVFSAPREGNRHVKPPAQPFKVTKDGKSDAS